jgi:nicotinate-nucleotide pyrophosphorylase (carboxylating)
MGLLKVPRQTGDLTSRLLELPDTETSARLVARDDLVVAGLGLVPMILMAYGPDCEFKGAARDADSISAGACLGTITGSARQLLEAERVILNFLQRLSGVATLTRRYVNALGKETKTRLLDTGKPHPVFACWKSTPWPVAADSTTGSASMTELCSRTITSPRQERRVALPLLT